jgi:hypothetical protein
VVNLSSTKWYSLTTLTNVTTNRERKLTKPLHAEGPGMELPLNKSIEGMSG